MYPKTLLVSFLLCCTLLSCCDAGIFRSEDFKTLGCPERRDITIIIDGVYLDLDPFLFSLNDLIRNEDCFAVYLYDPKQDDAIRLGKERNYNRMDLKHNYPYSNPHFKTLRFLKRKLKAKNKPKQTIVYMAVDYMRRDASQHYQILKKLQNEHNCDVIVFCSRDSCPKEIWMPPQRIFVGSPFLFNSKKYDWSNFAQIIKEPEYDPYEFAYQSIRSRDDFFPQTCLKSIETFHITMTNLFTFYFPMAVAVLRKENSKRRMMNVKPLKIKFYHIGGHWWTSKQIDIFGKIAKKIDGNLLIQVVNFGTIERDIPVDKENAVFRIHDNDDRMSSERDCYHKQYRDQSFKYRFSRTPIQPWSCFRHEKMKTFTTPLDLYKLMNEDLCSMAKRKK